MYRLLLVAVLLLAAVPASGQSNGDAEECWRRAGTNTDREAHIDVCSRAIESGKLTPKNFAVTHDIRGGAYYEVGDFDRAVEDFSAALQYVPTYTRAHIHRGMAYGMKGDHRRSLEDFDEAVRQDPQAVQAVNGRCYTLALMGDAVRAIDDCKRALALAPNTPYILDSRAYAYMRAGDFPRALADYDLILQLAPDTPEALYGRGIARLRLGRQQEGEQDLADARAADADIDSKMAKIGLTP